jgi:hypothetical protein
MDRVLGVAIGVATVCLLFSILASQLQELWASYSARRAASLETALGNMLNDPSLLDAFFNHPLVRSISLSATRTSILRPSAPLSPRPTYISSDQFRKVLQSILAVKNGVQSSDLPSLITALPDSPIKTRLQTLILGAEADAAACNTAVENWYDDTMKRISGLYKRNTQIVLLFLGFVLAVACNANLLRIAETLWTSAAARDEVAAVAQLYGCKDEASCNDKGKDKTDYTAERETVKDNLKLLPLGYGNIKFSDVVSEVRHPTRELLGRWAFNLCGLILMAIAVSLGSPFWFDLVNRLVNIRMVGQKPETAEDRKASAHS